jgi:hypothetical protein
LYAVV